MKNMTRAVKKGFTLLELIIVMALFSILMVAVMSIADPVSRIYKNTSVSTRSYNYANDIQVYIDTKLKYADNLWVVTSDNLANAHLISEKRQFDKALTGNPVQDADYKIILGNGNGLPEAADLASIVEAYRYEYYDQIVQPDDTSASALKDPNNYKEVNGKIYVMRIINKTENFDDSVAGEIPGQISLRTYSFDSFNSIAATENPTPSIELNPAYFHADDAVFDFNYTLGASDLVNASGDMRVLKGDVYDEKVTFSQSNPTIQLSIVLDQEKGISNDLPNCRMFNLPCTVTTCSTPLINIIERHGNAQGRYFWGADRENSPFDLTVEKIQNQNLNKADVNISKSFKYLDLDFDTSNDEADFDFTQDIFFIFSYADELN